MVEYYTLPLEPPSVNEVVKITSNSLTISWKLNRAFVDAVDVEYRQEGSVEWKHDTVNQPEDEYTLLRLKPSTL